MSRPAPHNRPLDSASTGWVARLNENFSECMDEQFPMAQYADLPALDAAADPRLYKGCRALVVDVIYSSDGTTWAPARELLTFITDLIPGAATIADIKNAYNGLLADMQVKGWMV